MKPLLAYTLVEIMVVVALGALILAIGVFATAGSTFVSDVLRTETDNIISTVRKAQLQSMYGVAATDHRVRFDTDRISITPTNEVIQLSGVTISSFQLANGGREVTFFHQFGLPSTNGSIVVQGPRGATRRIVITPHGMIEWQ